MMPVRVKNCRREIIKVFQEAGVAEQRQARMDLDEFVYGDSVVQLSGDYITPNLHRADGRDAG